MKKSLLSRDLRNHIMPRTTSLVFFGMFTSAGIIVIRLVAAVLEIEEPALPSRVAFLIVVGCFGVSLPLAAAYLVRRGWKWAPVLVTVLGFWSTSELLSYGDVLAYVSTVISILTIVAIWTPSARSYSRGMQDEQLTDR